MWRSPARISGGNDSIPSGSQIGRAPDDVHRESHQNECCRANGGCVAGAREFPRGAASLVLS